jgi:hypothetical protein
MVPAANQSTGPLYNKIRSELDLPTTGKNLFVDLVERIAKELNVSNCLVCGGTLMSEEWTWKWNGLNAYQLLLWNQSITRQESNGPQTYILTSEIIREECIRRTGPGCEKWVRETLIRSYSLGMGLI